VGEARKTPELSSPVVKVRRGTALRQAQGVLSLPKDEGGEAPGWQGATSENTGPYPILIRSLPLPNGFGGGAASNGRLRLLIAEC
jgi:hypothetical protein